jgi:hypothetical protein
MAQYPQAIVDSQTPSRKFVQTRRFRSEEEAVVLEGVIRCREVPQAHSSRC